MTLQQIHAADFKASRVRITGKKMERTAAVAECVSNRSKRRLRTHGWSDSSPIANDTRSRIKKALPLYVRVCLQKTARTSRTVASFMCVYFITNLKVLLG